MALLWLDGTRPEDLATFAVGAGIGVVPAGVALLATDSLIDTRLSLPAAMLVGTATWALAAAIFAAFRR